MVILSVFKFCVIWGIFLTWFADALLFDMMLKTSFEDPVNTVDDLNNRHMSLGKKKQESKQVEFRKVIFSHWAQCR